MFLILLLLTKAILNTRGDEIEIQPPDNYSVRELEMRNDALSHCPSSQLSLHLPMKGTKSTFPGRGPFPLVFYTMYLGTSAPA